VRAARPGPCGIGRPLTHLSAAFVVAAIWAETARAAPPPLLVPGAETFLPQVGAPAPGPFDFLTGISRSGYLLGNIWGLRGLLAQYGISLALSETSEVLGNLTGGCGRALNMTG
jgi:porin